MLLIKKNNLLGRQNKNKHEERSVYAAGNDLDLHSGTHSMEKLALAFPVVVFNPEDETTIYL